MNDIRRIIPCLLLLLLLGACTAELPGEGVEAGGDGLTLSLATRAATRVPEEGEDTFNENKIERADVYFFDCDATGNAEGGCIYARMGLVPSPVTNSTTDYTLQIPLDRTIISDDTSYYVYVVANHSLGYTDETAKQKTLAEIKATRIETAWKEGYTAGEAVIENSLVMDGGKQITIQAAQTTKEQIDMTHAMAKVMLYVSTEQTIEANDLTYTVQPRDMFATLAYGVKATNLAGTYGVNAEADYITRMRRDYNDSYTTTEDGKHRYAQVAPFYSYPNPETTADRKETYLILCVPWMAREPDGVSYQAVNYYYRVPITGDVAKLATLERNHYYKINVHIGVLGSINPNDAVEVKDLNYEIIDWFTVDIDADMQQYRYLVLDEYVSVMNNVDELEMPYISSSSLKMEPENGEFWEEPDTEYTRITSVKYWNYYDTRYSDQGYAHEETLTDQRDIENAGFTLEDDGNGHLVIRHPLDEDDYVPYTITVETWNEQGVKTDVWEITQYPGMYIEGEYNEDGYYNNWGNVGGNRFVYGVRSGDVHDDTGGNRSNNLGGVYDPTATSATNRNLNQYTIYITSFDVGDEYAIGDPRVDTPDRDIMGDLEDRYNNKKLTYYYPSKQEEVNDIETYGSVVAPAFKIASSWGVVDGNGITFEKAKRRCASYQENGYPAGRWRVPTEGEIEYIVGLSDAGKIPALFNGDYYASSGRYYDNGYRTNMWGGSYIDEDAIGFHDGSDGGHSVRCVYDVWYWGNGKISDPNEFTWGDEPLQ